MKEETKEIVEKAREIIHLIADKLKKSYNPEKIILFGSSEDLEEIRAYKNKHLYYSATLFK